MISRSGAVVVIALSLSACHASSSTPHPDGGDPHPPVFGELSVVITSDIVAAPIKPQMLDPGQTFINVFAGRGFATGDFNGDGHVDILALPSLFFTPPLLPPMIWINHGDGTFFDGTAEVLADPTLTTSSSNNIFVADFNGDGRDDLFVVDQGIELQHDPQKFPGGRNHLLLSGSDGKLHDASATLPVMDNDFNHVSSMADINQDGCMDVIITQLGGVNTMREGTYFLLGDCHGAFRYSISGLPPEIADFPCGSMGCNMVAGLDYQFSGTNGAADFDNDGVIDLMTASYGPDPVSGQFSLRFYRQAAAGFSEAGRLVPAAAFGDPTKGGGCSGLFAGDLDGDGRIDVVSLWENRDGTHVEVLHNDGNFKFSDTTPTVIGDYLVKDSLGSGASNFRLRDVDGDGDLDLVAAYTNTSSADLAGNVNFLYLNDGAGKLAPFRFTYHGAPATVATVTTAYALNGFDAQGLPLLFDANGDGVNDVVLVNSNHFGKPLPASATDYFIYVMPAGRP